MSIEETERKQNQYHFDRHTPDYRHQFQAVTDEMHARCPIAWPETYGGRWVAAGRWRCARRPACPRWRPSARS